MLRPKSSSSAGEWRGAAPSGRPSSHEIAHARCSRSSLADTRTIVSPLAARTTRGVNSTRAATMHHRLLLRLEHRAIFARVRDLEHDARAVRRLDAEVLIALARQLRRAPTHAEVFARQALGGLEVEAGTVVEHCAKR